MKGELSVLRVFPGGTSDCGVDVAWVGFAHGFVVCHGREPTPRFGGVQ